MLCQSKQGVKNCQKNTEFICRSCKTNSLLCTEHGTHHKRNTDHHVEFVEKSELDAIFHRSLKKEIKTCISKIYESSKVIVSMILQKNELIIKDLKKLSQNLKSLIQFRASASFIDKLSGLGNQIMEISDKMKADVQSQIKKVSTEILAQQKGLPEKLVQKKPIKGLPEKPVQKKLIKELSEVQLPKKIQNRPKTSQNTTSAHSKSKYMTLFEQLDYVCHNFYKAPQYTKEEVKCIFKDLKITNDGRYAFFCNSFLGMADIDCSLGKSYSRV